MALDSIEASADKIFYGLGCALLNEDGTPAIEQRTIDETASQFVARVKGIIPDIHTDVVKEISTAITKITATPNPKVIEKNSEPTASPAS